MTFGDFLKFASLAKLVRTIGGAITAQVNLRTGTEAALSALTTMGVGEVAVSTDKQTLVVRNASSPQNYVFAPGAPNWTDAAQAYLSSNALGDGVNITLLQALGYGGIGDSSKASGIVVASGGFTLDISAGPVYNDGGGYLIFCSQDAGTFTIASDGSGDWPVYSKTVMIVSGTPRLLMLCFDVANFTISLFTIGTVL